MKNKIIKFVFLVSLFFSIQSFANSINKIDFVGLNVISNTTLMSIIPVKIGDQYNENTSDEIIQTLFNTGYFSDISVLNKDDNLTITLVENPYIKYFNVDTDSSFSLSNWLSNEQEFLRISKLEELVESNELSTGNIFTKFFIKIIPTASRPIFFYKWTGIFFLKFITKGSMFLMSSTLFSFFIT